MVDDYHYEDTLYLLLYLLSCSKQVKNWLRILLSIEQRYYLAYFLKNALSF